MSDAGEKVAESVAMRLMARVAQVATPLAIGAATFVGLRVWEAQQTYNETVMTELRRLNDRVLRIEVRTEVLDEIRTNKIPRGATIPHDDELRGTR